MSYHDSLEPPNAIIELPVASAVHLSTALNPSSIAVIGASTTSVGYGGAIVKNLVRFGFPGAIYPVNPKYTEIDGAKCYASLDEVTGDVDLAVILTPKNQVLPVLQQCAAHNTRLAVIVTAGFAESGLVGSEQQSQLVGLARRTGIRLLGPNCLGFVSVHSRTVAAATWVLDVDELRPGGVSVLCHSGGLSFASALIRGHDHGVGFRYVVNSGNEADLNAADFIEYFVSDPQTRAIAAELETIRNPAKFRRAAARAAELGKPIVILKVGASEQGRRSAASHTGAIAGDAAVHEAIFRADGVTVAEDLDDLWSLPSFMASAVLPKGRRVAIVSSTGGTNGVIADNVARAGLQIENLTEPVAEELRMTLPGTAVVGNPMDLSGEVGIRGVSIFRDVIRSLQRDSGTDMIALALIPVHREPTEEMSALVGDLAISAKPVAVVAPGGSVSAEGLRPFRDAGVVIFDEPRKAAAALRHLANYAEFQARRMQSPISKPPSRQRVSWTRVEPNMRDIFELLSAYNVPITPLVGIATEDDLGRVASTIGYPLALKVDLPNVLHKSDVNGVFLGIGTERQLLDAYRDIERRFGVGAVVAQKMVPQGLEMLVGFQYDPQFGPVVVIGMGGIFVEILHDVQLLPVPFSTAEVHAALACLRGKPLLEGARGQKRRDIDALVGIVESVGALAADLGGRSLSALDLNPVILFEEGAGAVVVDARVVCATQEADSRSGRGDVNGSLP